MGKAVDSLSFHIQLQFPHQLQHLFWEPFSSPSHKSFQSTLHVQMILHFTCWLSQMGLFMTTEFSNEFSVLQNKCLRV